MCLWVFLFPLCCFRFSRSRQQLTQSAHGRIYCCDPGRRSRNRRPGLLQPGIKDCDAEHRSHRPRRHAFQRRALGLIGLLADSIRDPHRSIRVANADEKRRPSGILAALIEPARPTIASLLRDAGYETAGFGKWHLGFQDYDASRKESEQPVDYARPLRTRTDHRGIR